MEYDANGNLIKRTDTISGNYFEYTYDHRDRLIADINRSSSNAVLEKVTYQYDALNRLIAKSVDTNGDGTFEQNEYLVNDGMRSDQDNAGDQLAAILNTSGAVQNRYLYGKDVDEVLSEENLDSVLGTFNELWTLGDHQNSVRDVVDYNPTTNASTVVDHIAYGAFGNVIAESAPATNLLFGYTGREWDTDTNLQYNRARWYDPALGKWISQDPIKFDAGDANLYRYVENTPIFTIDPSGEFAHVPVVIGILAAAWYFSTPSVAAAPSPDEYGKLDGYFAANERNNGQNFVSMATMPAAGGVGNYAAKALVKKAISRVLVTGSVAGATHKLTNDGINEFLLPGTGISNYSKDPLGTAKDYGVHMAFWTGGAAIAEGLSSLTPFANIAAELEQNTSGVPAMKYSQGTSALTVAEGYGMSAETAFASPADTFAAASGRFLQSSVGTPFTGPGTLGTVAPTTTQQLLRLTQQPTTHTLSQIRNMRQPAKWQAGEQYVQELHGSAGQRHFPVNGTGGRYVDAPVDLPSGGVLAGEVKTYGQWRTVSGVPQRQTVPLSDHISSANPEGCLVAKQCSRLRSTLDVPGCSTFTRTA